MSRVQFRSDWSDVLSELDRLDSMPDGAMQARLNLVLSGAFFATQEAVHVDTSSLMGSGNAFSETNRDEWTGTVSYGGASPGRINNPVNYAEYERRRSGAKDGTSHDFMAPFFLFHDRFQEAIRDGLDGVG